MFKSIFAKLLFTITVVLSISFLMLAAILSNFANSYELDKQEEEVRRTANAARTLLEDAFLEAGVEDIIAFFEEQKGRYNGFLRIFLSNTDNMMLLISDPRGEVLVSANGTVDPPDLSGREIDASVLNKLTADGAYS